MLREGLEKIVRLTEDQSYSHAARMIEIRKEANLILGGIVKAELKAGKAPEEKGAKDGGQAGDKAKEPPKAMSQKITI